MMSRIECLSPLLVARLRAMGVPAVVGIVLLGTLFVGSTRMAGSASRAVEGIATTAPPAAVQAATAPAVRALGEGVPADEPGIRLVASTELSLGGEAAHARAADLAARLEQAMAGREFAFVPMEAQLTRASEALADELAAAFGDLPPGWQLRARVHAHTWGSSERNAEVSRERADVLRQRLLAAGLAPARLSVEGVGDAQPIENLWTPAGRREGRRIEVRIERERDHERDRTDISGG